MSLQPVRSSRHCGCCYEHISGNSYTTDLISCQAGSVWLLDLCSQLTKAICVILITNGTDQICSSIKPVYKWLLGVPLILKPTIHEATFVTGDTATLLFVHAAHEISDATFYKLLENRQPVYFQATCRIYHAIFPCAARTNNNVAVSPATKLPHVWTALQCRLSSRHTNCLSYAP